MAAEQFTNNTTTTVSSGGTDAPSSGTSQSWTVASSSSFPAAPFHVADPAAATEKALVTNVSGTTWTVTRGAESTTPVAHAAGFTVVQVVTAGVLGSFAQAGFGDLGGTGAAPVVAKLNGVAVTGTPSAGQMPTATGPSAATWQTFSVFQPWQFYVEDAAYGAKGDGKIVSDVATTISSKVITSATAGFTAGDVGKHVMIHGGNGTNAGALLDVIASVQSSTQATLTTNTAGASVSNCPMVWGTDDTSAINAAVTAAKNYAIANDYFAEVVFGAHIYCLASLNQIGDGSTMPTFNTQVVLPYPAANGTSQKLIFKLTGAGDAGYYQHWMSTTPNVSGTALVSMVTAPQSANPTFGRQSIVGGPTGSAGFSSNQGVPFANTKIHVSNMAVWAPVWPNHYAWDFAYISQASAEFSSAHVFAPSGVNAGAAPYLKNITDTGFQNALGTGWRFPLNQNGAVSTANLVLAEGYPVGFMTYDHFTATRLGVVYSQIALRVANEGGQNHLVSIQSFDAEAYQHGIQSITAGGSSNQCDIFINMEAECSPGSVTNDLDDSGAGLRGVVRFRDVADPTRTPILNGGNNVDFIWLEQAHAVQGAPSYTLGTAFQNPWFYPMWVQLSGGTVTNVQIGPVSGTLTSLATSTPVTFVLPANWWLSISGSVKPTTFNAVPLTTG